MPQNTPPQPSQGNQPVGAQARFEACLAHVLMSEGGFSWHQDDPGGATNHGVTLATYRTYRPGATVNDLRLITTGELRQIYRDGYWNKIRGDDLPAGLDLVAFDAAVNSGAGRSARWLQWSLSVSADGDIGPKTIAAAQAANAAFTIRQAIKARRSFLMSLATWKTFGRGWARRLANVESTALIMAKGA